jgi:tetratricopeptide (TPR) repeat protein
VKRPTKNRLLLAGFVLAMVSLSLKAPTWLVNSLSALGLLVVLTALYVARNFFAGRNFLKAKNYQLAAHRLIDFEKELLASRVKRALAWLFTGMYTSSGLALARCTLGAVRFEEGLLDESEVHFKQALAYDDQYAFAYVNLALVARQRGRESEEKILKEKAIELGLSQKKVDAALA